MDNKVLFVTTDGVGYVAGNPLFYVTGKWETIRMKIDRKGEYSGNPSRTFSTKAAAEAFVFENKPIYSVKDFRELIKTIEERFIPKIPQGNEV